jgi:hypothetical protein
VCECVCVVDRAHYTNHVLRVVMGMNYQRRHIRLIQNDRVVANNVYDLSCINLSINLNKKLSAKKMNKKHYSSKNQIIIVRLHMLF